VPAVAVACRILDALARPDIDGATLTELSRLVAVSKSTLHGQLATLEAHGLVHRNPETRRFRLGAALVSLGRAAGRDLQSTDLAAQSLPELARQERLTFGVAQVIESTDAVVVDRAYPPEAVHIGLTLGSHYGAFDGAIGKCLLAAMPPKTAERVVCERDIPRHTSHTIVDAEELLEDVERVRSRGWATSERELKESHAVAVPLWNRSGLDLVLFAVGFPGQLPADRLAIVGALLRRTAADIENILGASARHELAAAS
jgi:DNA-binding IclR family transcriptional regulator